jgi:hypothetical protein
VAKCFWWKQGYECVRTLQPLDDLTTRTLTWLSRLVVDIDTLAPHTVVCQDDLRLVVDLELAPVIFLVRFKRAFDDDVGPELSDVHVLAFGEPRGNILKG